MKILGSVLLVLGVAALALDSFGYRDFVAVSWIYTWGRGVAWAIICSVVVLGSGLFLFGDKLTGRSAAY
jgi:hypothetical protein